MRVLMLGNSLTTSNDMPRMLQDLLRQNGHEDAKVDVIARGGARLAEFSNPNTKSGARVAEALSQNQYDFVVMQDMSHQPATNLQKHIDGVKRLVDLISQVSPASKAVVYGTWGYAPTCPKLEKLKMTCQEMHKLMAAGTSKAAQENDCIHANVAIAFHSKDNDELYSPDGIHPSAKGSQLAAQVLAKAILDNE